MATTKPRITITVDQRIYETITRLCKLSGQSKSDFIGDLLETVHQPLMRTVALLEAVSESPGQIKDGLRGVVEMLERQLLNEAGETFLQMDFLMQKLTPESRPSKGTGAMRDAQAAGGAPVFDPPLVTRGSGFKKLPEQTTKLRGK